MREPAPGREPAEAHSRRLPKTATGIRGLDEVLQGGLPAGRTTLLTGTPGTGKTVISIEFAYRGAVDGEPGLVVSFEEREQAVRANAATLGFDLADLERVGTIRVIHAALPMETVHSGDFDLHGLLAFLGAQVDSIGARRIVLDAVDQLVRVFGDRERERSQLHLLHDWLLERGLTAVLTLKAEPGGELIYPFLGFLADCVVHLDQRMEAQVRTRRLRVVKYRGSGFLSNEYPYVFTDDGVVVMPVSLVGLERDPDDARVSSGDLAFDQILGGGYRTGSSVLIAGPTGAGKTTLACLFAASACTRSEPVLYVSFEESKGTLLEAMARVGLDPGGTGNLEILETMPESRGVEEHLLAILSALGRLEARHLVVDAISACRSMGSERAAFDFLVRLITAARHRGATMLMTNQGSNREQIDDVSGIGVSSLIDTVVLIRFQTEADAVRRRLLVLKSRGSRHSNRYHWLEIGDDGISLSATGIEPGELPAGHVPPRGSGG